MAEFSRLNEAFPVMSGVQPADKSAGKEALADVFGNVSKVVTEHAISVSQEERSLKLLQAKNQISEIANKGKIDGIMMPDQIATINENARNNSKGLFNGVDARDHEKLRAYVDQEIGGMELTNARIGHKQITIQGKLEFNESWPQTLSSLQQNFNPDTFQQGFIEAHNALEAGLKAGILTPTGYQAQVKNLQDVLAYHQDINEMLAGNKDIDAKKFATMQAISFNNQQVDNAGQPIDQTTKFFYDNNNNDRTLKTAKSDASRGIFPNLNTLMSLKPHERAEIKENYLGAVTAKGFINSNSSIAEASLNYKRLAAKAPLTARESGEYNYYHQYFKALANGDAVKLQANTNEGAKIEQDYIQQTTAISNRTYPGNTPEEAEQNKIFALNDARNDKYDKRLSLQEAQHTPAWTRQAIDNEVIQETKSAFAVGGDPKVAVGQLYNLRPDMHWFLSKEMDDPKSGKHNKSESLYAAGLLRNAAPHDEQPSLFAQQLVYANRDGRDDSVLKFEDKASKEAAIRSNIRANMADTLHFAGSVPNGDIPNSGFSSGILDAGVNWVKDQMIKHGDINGDHVADYAQSFARQMNHGYNIYRGLDSQFNLNEVHLTPAQCDLVQFHMMGRFREQLKHPSKDVERSDIEVSNILNQLPVSVTNTRDGHIAIIDQSGTVYMTEKLDSKLLAQAKERKTQNEKVAKEMYESMNSHSSLGLTDPATNVLE